MQASNPEPRPLTSADYRRMRRKIVDDLVDAELRRRERCEKARKALGKVGLAAVPGVVTAILANLLGVTDKILDALSLLIHGGHPK